MQGRKPSGVITREPVAGEGPVDLECRDPTTRVPAGTQPVTEVVLSDFYEGWNT